MEGDKSKHRQEHLYSRAIKKVEMGTREKGLVFSTTRSRCMQRVLLFHVFHHTL